MNDLDFKHLTFPQAVFSFRKLFKIFPPKSFSVVMLSDFALVVFVFSVY